MEEVEKAGVVRTLIAEALRRADALGMTNVGIYLDRARVALDEAVPGTDRPE